MVYAGVDDCRRVRGGACGVAAGKRVKMPPIDPGAIANFGFAAIVALILLLRLEKSMGEVRDAARELTAKMNEQTATNSRLADAINRVIIRRVEQ